MATLLPSDGTSLLDFNIPHFDKVVHLGLFAVHGFLVLLSISEKKVLATIAVGMLLAIVTEFGQSFVPGRSMDINDGIADMIGSICGIIVASIYIKNEDRK